MPKWLNQLMIVSCSPNSGLRAAAEFKGKIALLTNFLPPYRIKVLELLMGSVGCPPDFRFRPDGINRRWNANWGALDVTVQRSLSWSSRDVHGNGFQEDRTIHFPYDTVFQLRSYRPDAIIASEFGLRTVQAALYNCLFPPNKAPGVGNHFIGHREVQRCFGGSWFVA
jgi:hypothetical protein